MSTSNLKPVVTIIDRAKHVLGQKKWKSGGVNPRELRRRFHAEQAALRQSLAGVASSRGFSGGETGPFEQDLLELIEEVSGGPKLHYKEIGVVDPVRERHSALWPSGCVFAATRVDA